MKRNYLIGLIVIILTISGAATVYISQLPTDRCTTKDRSIGNCVPAGSCGPTPEIDARTDCQPSDYDRKFNPSR